MTLLLAISSILSRLLGVIRNHQLANTFGTSELSDAYFAAFQIPDLLYRLVVFGAISAAFVPIFLTLRKQDSEKAWEFTTSVLNVLSIFILAVSAIAWVFAYELVGMTYPSFDQELVQTTSELLRIMLLCPFFFSLSSVFGAVQNAYRQLWGYALAPIVYNAGILFGIVYLAEDYGIMGVAYGVLLGSILHALVQLIPTISLGLRWRPSLHWDESMKALFITGIPRVLTMIGIQVNFFVEGIIATFLMTGSITVLRYAQDIQSFPIGVIGVSVAITSFSVVSQMVIDGRDEEVRHYLGEKIDQILLLLIPAAVGLAALRIPVVELLLAGGSFDTVAVNTTADTLLWLCIGIPPSALIPLLSRVFFAYHDTRSPLWITLGMVLVNTISSVILGKSYGVVGIGMANALSSSIAVLLCMASLKHRHMKGRALIHLRILGGSIISSALMGAVIWYGLSAIGLPASWLGKLLTVLVWCTLGVGISAVGIRLMTGQHLYRLLRPKKS
jgi:putative peptidoglycan lipid II flippase